MRSWKTPTADQVNRVVALLMHIERQRYFFSRLENPEWVEPLRDKGYFQNPPAPRQDEETATILFPFWPESRYLARMAPHKPELVRDIIRVMPNTENPEVLTDLAAALACMPPGVAAQLADKATEWARSPYVDTRVLPRKLASVATHLARGGHTAEALNTVEALFEVTPDPSLSQHPRVGGDRPTPEPVSRINAWDYQEIIAACVPTLADNAGIPVLDTLCCLLEEAARLSRLRRGKDGTDDLSYIWRPAVENHPQNWKESVRSTLVSAVRDTAERLVATSKATVREVVALLERHPYRIFRRIALHLLARFPDEVPELVSSRLTDRVLFDDVGVRHEYALLMRACFGRLSPEDQKTILGWIKAGPDLQLPAASIERATGERPTGEALARRRELWQRDRLAWIEGDLPEDWRAYSASLVERHGKPEHADFPVYFDGVSWVGPTSPKSQEELQRMRINEINAFLRAWRPAPSLFGEPSPKGLGRELAEVVAREPERFAAEATTFKGLDPTYVRALVEGLDKAVSQGHVIDWRPVLELCQWVLDHPRDMGGRQEDRGDRDPGWGWSRGAVAMLLSSGLEGGSGTLPFEMREDVWSILLTLTDDPEPSPEYEAEYGGSNLDPATMSINTVRGKAVHAVVQYALWVRRSLNQRQETGELSSRGFEDMPEVRKVLTEHLDHTRDPSLAVRSVYGQRLGQLIALDATWVREHVDLIFPLGEEVRDYFAAAWESYLAFHRPGPEGLDLLRNQYTRAVSDLARAQSGHGMVGRPDEALAEHLMVLYWIGALELGDSILELFWENASDKLCGHALSSTGWALGRTESEVPENVLSRLRALWEAPLSAAQSEAATGSHQEELAAFGSWFVSGKFDDEWVITQLLQALTLSRRAEPHHRVIDRLSQVPDRHLREAVQCLRLMAEGDRDGWRIFSWQEALRAVLGRALALPAAKGAAEDLVNYLASRGFHAFRDLIG